MIIYGRRATTLHQQDVHGITCNHCQNADIQRVTVFGKFAHVYWVPLFPMGKETVAECQHCKKTIPYSAFNLDLQQASAAIRTRVKTPLWNWSGLMAVGGLFLLVNIIEFFRVDDPRLALLEADLERTSIQPDSTRDSVSFKLKKLFNEVVVEEMDAEDFELYTSVKENKILVLCRIPNFKDVQKDARKELLDIVDMLLDAQPGIAEKDRYIGVHGRMNMMMVKTPKDFQSANLVAPDPLFEFYGSAGKAPK